MEKWEMDIRNVAEMRARIINEIAFSLLNNGDDNDALSDFLQAGMRAYAIETAYAIHDTKGDIPIAGKARFYLSDSQYDEVNNPAMIFAEFHNAFSGIIDFDSSDKDSESEIMRNMYNAMRNSVIDAMDSFLEDRFWDITDMEALYNSDDWLGAMHIEFDEMISDYIKIGD